MKASRRQRARRRKVSKKTSRSAPVRMESLEVRAMLAAAPPVLAPPAGLTLMNPATVPMFANNITGLNPLAFHYDADTPNHFSVAAQPIQVDLGLGLNPATSTPYLTNMFGYVDANPASPVPSLAPYGVYYGKSFEVQQNAPIAVTWVNNLPAQHVANIDPTLLDLVGMGMGMGTSYDPLTNSIAGGIPITTHLHGGHTDAIYDGTPMQWYNAGGSMGMDYVNTQQYNPTQPANTYTYRNDQDAATLWYHDHAMGVTRLNAYAGMAGFYIVRDGSDTGTPDDPATPVNENPLGLPVGAYEMGLAIQDKQFLSNGQIWFGANAQAYTDPVTGNTGTVASTLPEQFGDVILVNGKAWPKMDVEARRYRFRLINGSDSRFYTLSVASSSPTKKNAPNTKKTLPIWQIGTDQGLLNQAVQLQQLTIAPGERADFIIDFTGVAAGTRFVLTNSARAPFPGGAPVANGTTDRVMAFDVIAANPLVPDTSKTPAQLAVANALRPVNVIPTPAVVAPTRQMALYETTDGLGRITPLLGTPASSAEFMDPITENIAYDPINGTTEVWEIFNNTADTHPIHLHQVGFQILTRQTFSTKLLNLGASPSGAIMWGMQPGTLKYMGAPIVATGNEIAWKDTIQLNPGEVITVRARFDLPGKYVTHCHILSHEEHDMMRFMQIGADPFPVPAIVVHISGAGINPLLAPAPSPALANLFSTQPIGVLVEDPDVLVGSLASLLA